MKKPISLENKYIKKGGIKMNGLITDLYQLTMANALFKKNRHERKVVFDRFYRKNPFNGGYTIVAGLEHLQQFLEKFRFDEEDIAYLKSLQIFLSRLS